MIQSTLTSPKPAWSKDDWSFVPVVSPSKDSDFEAEYISDSEISHSLTNLTVQTPEIRARLNCSVIRSKNDSHWLNKLENPSFAYSNATRLASYYQLKETMAIENSTTMITAQSTIPQCCSDSTEGLGQEKPYTAVSIAYWSENTIPSVTGRKLSANFTIKWIRGLAGFVKEQDIGYGRILMFLPEPPAIQVLNCIPSFEASEAEVIVDTRSGVIQDYRTLTSPLLEDVAWSDDFQYRNFPENPRVGDFNGWRKYETNVTTR